MSIADLPRLVRAVLTATLPGDWRQDILRDLEEAWTLRRAERGALLARGWLWGQALVFSFRFAPERISELVSGPRPTSADLKLALRSAAKAPLVTLLAVVSLAVGIGAAVGGVTIVEGGLFTDLPFEGGDRIYWVQDYDRKNRFAVDVGPDEFLRRRGALQSFEYLSAYVTRTVVVGAHDGNASVERALFATPGFLRMTAVSPMLGRLPDARDVVPGAEPVVVLPHPVWLRATGGDPDVVGSQIELAGIRRTVIGVMPEDFGFPWDPVIWIPFDARDADAPLRMIGKLREGVALESARAEMGAVARPDPTQIEDDAEVEHLVTGITRPMTDDSEVFVLAIPIAVLVLLLLVMATNVANLILARNASRAPELAVRGALGASRARLVGQLVTEVVVMVALASVLGVWLSRVGISMIVSRVNLPFWTDFSLDPLAVAFTVAMAALVTFVAGVAPALQATGSSPADALRDGGRGSSGIRFGRLTGVLIVAQITICVGFLSAATLLGQSLMTYDFERYGLPGHETLIAQLYFGWPPELDDPDARWTATERVAIREGFMKDATRKREEIRRRMLELPGVRAAAYGSRFPGNESEREYVEIEGFDGPPGSVEVAEVGEGYFELVDAELVQGRGFEPGERADALPVALVNEPFVRERLGGAGAVGRRIRLTRPADGEPSEPSPWMSIVGVVPDLGLNPGNPARAAGVYRPMPDLNIMRLAVRGDGEVGALTPLLVDVVAQVDPAIRVQWTRTLARQMREPVMIFRGLGFAFLVMGGLALLLSAASIHALTACTVTRRTREIGIRQALGAGAGRIVREVLRRSAGQLAIGLVLGTGLAVALLRLSTVFPWEVRQGNPAALGIVVGALVSSGVLALAQPLRRALSIRPADAMRVD